MHELKECIKKYLGILENKKRLTQEDQQIITRLLTEESMITGESPEGAPMTRNDLNSFYEKQIQISGLEILDKIKKNGKPVIFISGHFANFELMSLVLT